MVRRLGQVRTCWGHKTWSARFQLRLPGERATIDGPARERRADAETDRKFVAVALAQVPRSSKLETVKAAVANLRTGRRQLPAQMPGSASNGPTVALKRPASSAA